MEFLHCHIFVRVQTYIRIYIITCVSFSKIFPYGVLAPQRHLVPGAAREIGRTSREPRPCPALRASAPSFRDAVDVGSSSIAEDRDESFTQGINALQISELC
ncbi:hypothetical protein PUN28_016057 [Cardiocondyla obscurior]|uniref:Uncharacterized protein n=1 Tax=Cardiocondyla obscurior TaxID=286306 RepID=A0AAW2EV33_9HYME